MKKFFKKNNNIKLPVNEKKFLLEFLTPTSKGTKYYDSPPPSEVKNRQIGRMLLQVHQLLSIFKSLNININNKSFLDLGTGNGMIPRILLETSTVKEALGADPYLDGEHTTSWQKHDHNKTIKLLRNFIKIKKNNKLKFQTYKDKLTYENFSFIPQDIKFFKQKSKKFKFAKLGATDIYKLKKKYDIVYCKAIEHISNWNKIFQNLSLVTKEGSIVYFKHRSFFSYLGPHRYSSTAIPWGHVLLNDGEMKRYVKIFHKGREKQFLKFFYSGLAYPRFTVNEMIEIAQNNGFGVLGIQIEPPRYAAKSQKLIKKIPNFWKIVRRNYPKLSSDELLSGMYHIIFKKL